MKVAVVGGGITGLFAAQFLQRGGAETTIFEAGAPGARSAHAAGIIEPMTAYRTNTLAFLKRVVRYWRRGTCRFRGVDPRWLATSLVELERSPLAGAEESLRRLGRRSIEVYETLARPRNDFGYAARGLVETFDDPAHFAEASAAARANQEIEPVEIRPQEGRAGALYFPQAAWLHTERFVDRISRDLSDVPIVRERVVRVTLDGAVTTATGAHSFDAVVVCSGTTSRALGVPLTGVRGFGWHLKVARPVDVATIHVDSGVALVPFPDELKATGGWDFDLSEGTGHAARVLEAVRRATTIDAIAGFSHGSRPCTPDGLPTVGRKERIVIANGGFRLGWSFAPGLGEQAALLAVGQATNDPFLARYVGTVRSGPLA